MRATPVGKQGGDGYSEWVERDHPPIVRQTRPGYFGNTEGFVPEHAFSVRLSRVKHSALVGRPGHSHTNAEGCFKVRFSTRRYGHRSRIYYVSPR